MATFSSKDLALLLPDEVGDAFTLQHTEDKTALQAKDVREFQPRIDQSKKVVRLRRGIAPTTMAEDQDQDDEDDGPFVFGGGRRAAAAASAAAAAAAAASAAYSSSSSSSSFSSSSSSNRRSRWGPAVVQPPEAKLSQREAGEDEQQQQQQQRSDNSDSDSDSDGGDAPVRRRRPRIVAEVLSEGATARGDEDGGGDSDSSEDFVEGDVVMPPKDSGAQEEEEEDEDEIAARRARIRARMRQRREEVEEEEEEEEEEQQQTKPKPKPKPKRRPDDEDEEAEDGDDEDAAVSRRRVRRPAEVLEGGRSDEKKGGAAAASGELRGRRRRADDDEEEEDEEEAPRKEEDEEEDEEEEESSEYETDTDASSSEEEETERMKPVFISKAKRDTIAEAEAEAAKEEAREAKRAAAKVAREAETRSMVAEVIKREEDASRTDGGMGAGNTSDAENMPDDTDPPSGDEKENGSGEAAVEYEAWRQREHARLKRDRALRERWANDKAETERRRGLTEEERRAEDAAAGRLLPEEQRAKKLAEAPKRKFMQKYYHRGAFYMDEDEMGADDVRKRKDEYAAGATGDDVFDKAALPKPMQVKKFGFAGQSKYTHLKDQDTTDFNSAWMDTKNQRRAALDSKLAGVGDIDTAGRKKKKTA